MYLYTRIHFISIVAERNRTRMERREMNTSQPVVKKSPTGEFSIEMCRQFDNVSRLYAFTRRCSHGISLKLLRNYLLRRFYLHSRHALSPRRFCRLANSLLVFVSRRSPHCVLSLSLFRCGFSLRNEPSNPPRESAVLLARPPPSYRRTIGRAHCRARCRRRRRFITALYSRRFASVDREPPARL